MELRVENWNGHNVRFVEKEAGQWWAVAMDIATALGYTHTPHMVRKITDYDKDVQNVDTLGGVQQVTIISEFGIYEAIWGSRKPEAASFKRWVFDVISELRKASGLEAYQVFRMLDKEHQKAAMQTLRENLVSPSPKDFIKANTIANKAISTRMGYPKMLKKEQMSPDMLSERQPILEDTVMLMAANKRFDMGLSVSKLVYDKYAMGTT